MKRIRASGLGAAVVTAGLLLTTIASAQPTTSNVEPPRDIRFRDPFVGRDAEVLNTNLTPPDSIVFRDVFVGRGDAPLQAAVPPPRGIAFREPFVGRGDSEIRPGVSTPEGIVFRPLFLARDGAVLQEDVQPPEGLVFRDVIVGRDGALTAAPPRPGTALIERASVLPNPFNPSTQISFRLTREAEISVAVYDARGRLLRILHRGTLAADAHVMSWDGTDDEGAPVGSGVYFVRVAAEDETVVVKGVLVE